MLVLFLQNKFSTNKYYITKKKKEDEIIYHDALLPMRGAQARKLFEDYYVSELEHTGSLQLGPRCQLFKIRGADPILSAWDRTQAFFST